MATNYSSGADFERTTMRDLESHGYAVVRSAGSHSPADLVAMRDGRFVLVQCKRNGRLYPDEWNEFLEFCEYAGGTPILASKGPRGGGIIYRKLTSRKGGRGRQPLAPWVPQSERG